MAVAIAHPYRVGDRVKMKLGAHEVVATVIEDRGFIGHAGQQVVRVSVPVDPAQEEAQFEVSASLVEPVRGRGRSS